MIQPQALRKTKILVFAEKHGIETALEAFEVKRRTFFCRKKQWIAGGKIPEALNPIEFEQLIISGGASFNKEVFLY